MTKLLVAVIGVVIVLVVATGVQGVVLWDMKSRDAGLTVQVAKDKWVESRDAGLTAQRPVDGPPPRVESRDADLTVQWRRDTWVESGYEVRMAREGDFRDVTKGGGAGYRDIPLVFTVLHNGSPADGLTVSLYLPLKYPQPTTLSPEPGPVILRSMPPDRSINPKGAFGVWLETDSKGQVRATLSLPLSDGPGSIIHITVIVYGGSTSPRLGQSIKTIRLE